MSITEDIPSSLYLQACLQRICCQHGMLMTMCYNLMKQAFVGHVFMKLRAEEQVKLFVN